MFEGMSHELRKGLRKTGEQSLRSFRLPPRPLRHGSRRNAARSFRAPLRSPRGARHSSPPRNQSLARAHSAVIVRGRLWYSSTGTARAATMLSSPVVLEPDLVKRFARADREAFLAVYEAYAPALRALVARFFPRPFEREEAVQEVWLMIHRNAVSFDPSRGDLLPWLRTVAANRCKELLRAQGRRPRAESEIDEDGLSESANPEATVGARRLCRAVARFAEGLSPEEASAATMTWRPPCGSAHDAANTCA